MTDAQAAKGHTALPWTLDETDPGTFEIFGKPDGFCADIVLHTPFDNPKDATLIVERVNKGPAADAMCEALERAYAIVDSVRIFIGSEYQDKRYEEHGEWLAPEAREPHADLCELTSVISEALTAYRGEA